MSSSLSSLTVVVLGVPPPDVQDLEVWKEVFLNSRLGNSIAKVHGEANNGRGQPLNNKIVHFPIQ